MQKDLEALLGFLLLKRTSGVRRFFREEPQMIGDDQVELEKTGFSVNLPDKNQKICKEDKL